MSRSEKPIEINEQSRVPLYILWMAVVGTASVVGLFWSIDTRLRNIERQVQSGWTYSDQETWSLKLKADNPALKVPEPKDSHHPPLAAASPADSALQKSY